MIETPDFAQIETTIVAETVPTDSLSLIEHVPGIIATPEELAPLNATARGEYTGGDIDRIARRSGVDPEEVARAALESMARQRSMQP